MNARRCLTLLLGAALAITACVSPARKPPATEPVIEISDVDLFYRIYDAAGGRPSEASLEADYLQAGSDGLRTFARLRATTGKRIADAVAASPEIYQSARGCAAALPKVKSRLQAALGALAAQVPEARFPPVTIAVGRGRPVGVGDPATGVQIGLEALCAASFLNPDIEDRFVYVITHEYVHVQQHPALGNGEAPTVLEASLMEGIAEFITEQIAGSVSYGHLAEATKGRELDIETAFAAEANGTGLSAWLYNTGEASPADLGYWTGYRIAKAYYRNSPDKSAAIREMLAVEDAESFLKSSGWHPGIVLD